MYSGANAVNEEDSERERYPGVEDFISRATFPGETHPYPSWLRYCEEEEEEEESLFKAGGGGGKFIHS